MCVWSVAGIKYSILWGVRGTRTDSVYLLRSLSRWLPACLPLPARRMHGGGWGTLWKKLGAATRHACLQLDTLTHHDEGMAMSRGLEPIAMHLCAAHARALPLVLAAVESEAAVLSTAAGIDGRVLHHKGRAFACARYLQLDTHLSPGPLRLRSCTAVTTHTLACNLTPTRNACHA